MLCQIYNYQNKKMTKEKENMPKSDKKKFDYDDFHYTSKKVLSIIAIVASSLIIALETIHTTIKNEEEDKDED